MHHIKNKQILLFSSLVNMESIFKTWYICLIVTTAIRTPFSGSSCIRLEFLQPSCYFRLQLSCTQNLIRSLAHLYFLDSYMKMKYIGRKKSMCLATVYLIFKRFRLNQEHNKFPTPASLFNHFPTFLGQVKFLPCLEILTLKKQSFLNFVLFLRIDNLQIN